MRWVVALGLLAVALVPAFALIGRGVESSNRRIVVELGPARPEAPLVRRPARGVVVSLDRTGFRVAAREATVSLGSLRRDPARWTRYEGGVERPTPFGHETILVAPEKTEQFLTIARRQGPKTWRWRLAAGDLRPRVGADGAVGLFSGPKLLGMHVEPAAVFAADGRDVTPDGLRWSLARDRAGWLLELRLDDRELPLPYVIDPAVTHRASQTSNNGAAGAASITLTMPAGVADRDLLFMHIAARGGNSMTIATPAGWTQLRNTNNASFVRLGTFYRIASSEPASYNVTFGGTTPSQQAVGAITAYSGIKSSLGAAGVLDVNGATGNGNSVSPSAGSITTLTANALVLAAYSHGYGSGVQTSQMFTQATGMTERYDAQSGSAVAASRSGLAADDMMQGTVGATGAKAVTAGASGRWVAHQASFKVDNVNPTATQNDPGANLRATVTIDGSASDADSSVASVQFQYSPAGTGTWANIGAADTTSPYSVSFDTTAVADGLYDLRAVATDVAGNSAGSALVANRRIDNTSPSGSVTAPAGGASVRGTISVDSDSADAGSGVASAQFQRSPAGAGTWTNIGAADTASPYWATFDTTAVSDGLYDLRVVTTDNVGNSFTSAIVADVRVDNTNPTGSLLVPASGANVRGTISVDSDSADAGSGVASAQFQRSPAGAGTWTNIGAADTSSPYSASFATTAVADGLYDLRVVTTDNAGNALPSAVVANVRVDNTNPSGSVTAPSAGANVRETISVYADSADAGSGVASAQYQRSPAGADTWTNIGAADTTSPYWATFDTTAVSDGLYDLRVVTTDNVGNSFTSAIVADVRVDNADPSALIMFPASPAAYSASGWAAGCTSAGICGTQSDGGSGVQQVEASIRRVSTGLYWSGGSFSSSSETFSLATPAGASWSFGFGAASFPADGDYTVHVRAIDNSGNVEPGPSRTFTFDDSPASEPTLSFGTFSNASVSGSTVYYRPSSAGSFTVTAGSSDLHSGVTGYSFPTLAAGWTASGSGTSRTYSYSAGASEPGAGQNVTATNGANLTSSPASFTVTADSNDPTGQSISAPAYVTTTSIAFTTADGSDSESGLETSTRLVQRAEAPLADDECGSFGSFSGSYSSPDTSVSTGYCYRYELTISDKVGNVSAPVSVTVKVDTSAPGAPGLTYGSFSNATLSGGVVYYRPSARAGQFAVTASSSDAETGLASYDFPAAAAGWTRSVAGATATYSHSGSPSDPAEPNDATARNNAGLDSSATSFAANPDASDPASSIECDGGACPSWAENPVSVTLSATDTGSGLAEIRYTTDGSDPTATTGTSYSGAFVVSSTTDVRFRAFDRVGNLEPVRSQLIQFDTSAPTVPALTVSETPADPDQYVSGTTLFYRPGGGRDGSFSVTAATGDTESGIDRVTFPAIAGMTGGGDIFAGPYESLYSWSSGSDSGQKTVTARNNGGLQSSASFTVTADTTGPSGQTIDLVGGPYYTSLSVPLARGNGSDADSGLEATSGVAEREAGTLSDGSCVSWSGTWTTVTLVDGADTSVLTNACYRYRYSISDNVGNPSAPSPASAVARVDATVPVTSDDAPAGWKNVATTVTLSVNESGSGVASTQYRVDGGAFQNGTSIVIPAPGDHSNDGVHTVEYRSTDAAGNGEGIRSTTVRIDTTLPLTTDNAPGGWRSSPVTVTLMPSDALSGIASTWYRVDGGAFQSGTSVAIPAPGDHSNDGLHTIEYRSTDAAGNVEPLSSATVRIDTTPPSGSVSAPADGAHVNGNVALSAAAADAPSGVTSVEFLVKPAGAGSFSTISTDTSAPYAASWDSTDAPEGAALLKVVVVDAVSNSATSAIVSVVVDNPPAPTLDDPGANLSGTVNLSTSSPDDTAQVVFERSPAGAGTWTPIATDTTAPYVASFDTRSVGDERYDFRAVATDLAGFGGTSNVRTSRVDNTAPTVSVSDPGSGAVVGGPNVHVGALASDSGSGVASVRFEMRPAGALSFAGIGTDTTAPFDAAWDASALAGSYELRAVATDSAGNPAPSVAVLVTVDATAPSVTLADPGAAVRGTITLGASTQSAAVARVVFKSKPSGGDSWAEIETDTAGPWSAAFDTRTVPDGLIDLRAQATDAAGTVLAAHTREGIRVDNTAPTIVSTSPQNGSTVESATSLVLVASEPVAAVQAPVFDGAGAAPEIFGSRVTFATGSLGQGAHELTGAVEDAVGNPAPFRLSFTLKPAPAFPRRTLALGVGRPGSMSRGKQQLFVVPITISQPATVQTTLLSPTGRRLRTRQRNLPAGRHTVRIRVPRASLPPGRYTIVVRATSADGTQTVKRVYVTIKRAKATRSQSISPKSVMPRPEGSANPPPSEGEPPTAETSLAPPPAPPPHRTMPEQSTKAHLNPLKAASAVAGAKHRRTIAVILVLGSLGSMVGFLVMIELQRALASPRRFK